jgi:hypothetical protein
VKSQILPPLPPPVPPPFFGPCVPDNDPRVIYSTSWSLIPHGFFQTSHLTDVPGSSLSLNFTSVFSPAPRFLAILMLQQELESLYSDPFQLVMQHTCLRRLLIPSTPLLLW